MIKFAISTLVFLSTSVNLNHAKVQHQEVYVNTVKRLVSHFPVSKSNSSWDDMVDVVKSCESFRKQSYKCPAGVTTIGYGHTGKYVKLKSLTETKAEKILQEDLKKSRALVFHYVHVPLTESQSAALTSFTFNCGEKNLKLLVNGPRRLNSGNYESVPKLLKLYTKAKGKELAGLKKRRALETKLWNS